MSEVELHIGKLKKIDLNGLSAEEWCKQKCDQLGYDVDYTYDSYQEALAIKSDKYIVVNNKVYEIDEKSLDPYDGIDEFYDNGDGTYSYIMEFYNGGTCLLECLESNLENIE